MGKHSGREFEGSKAGLWFSCRTERRERKCEIKPVHVETLLPDRTQILIREREVTREVLAQFGEKS